MAPNDRMPFCLSVSVPSGTAVEALAVQDVVSRPSLTRNVIRILTGNAVYALCQWVILILLARSGNSVAVGRFSLALAVTAPVFVAAGLQLRAVQAADSRREFLFGEFLGLRMVAAGIALVVVLLIGALYGRAMWLCIALMGAAKAVECLSDIVCGVFEIHDRMDLVTRSMLFRGIGSLAAVTLCTLYSDSVALVILALLITRVTVLLTYERMVCRRLRYDISPRFCWSRLFRLSRLVWPLGFVTMLNSAGSNIPRYQIERSLGTSELGVFSALSYLLTAASVLISAVGQSTTPRLAAALSSKRFDDFVRTAGKLAILSVAAGMTLVLVAAAGGPAILRAIYGPEYASRPEVFTMLAVSAALGFPASIASYCITAAQLFTIQVPVMLLVAGVIYAGASLMIPTHGLTGASAALVAGSTVQLALSLAILTRTLNRRRHAAGQ